MWQRSFQCDRRPAEELNEQCRGEISLGFLKSWMRFQVGLLVKLLASPAGGTEGTGFEKKVSQLLGLRHGRQPHEEGFLPLDWQLKEWPRSKDHVSGKGIAGNWFTSASLVCETLALDGGTALYGCNRYACGR